MINIFSVHKHRYSSCNWTLQQILRCHFWLNAFSWKVIIIIVIVIMEIRLIIAKLELSCFDVLLTVHLNIFVSVINQLDAQNLFHNKFYFMPLRVSSTCAHHQGVKIALHSLWYHHTETSEWSYRCDCDDTRCFVMQFWPPDDEHMCSKHVEAWNKTYCETNFVHQVG